MKEQGVLSVHFDCSNRLSAHTEYSLILHFVVNIVSIKLIHSSQRGVFELHETFRND